MLGEGGGDTKSLKMCLRNIWMVPNYYASGLINFSNYRWIIFNVDCGNVKAYNWPTSTLLLWSLSASVWRSRLLFRPNALSRPYLYYKLHLFPKFEWRDCGPCSGIIYVWTFFVFILQVKLFYAAIPQNMFPLDMITPLMRHYEFCQ